MVQQVGERALQFGLGRLLAQQRLDVLQRTPQLVELVRQYVELRAGQQDDVPGQPCLRRRGTLLAGPLPTGLAAVQPRATDRSLPGRTRRHQPHRCDSPAPGGGLPGERPSTPARVPRHGTVDARTCRSRRTRQNDTGGVQGWSNRSRHPAEIGAFDELTEEHLRAAGSLKWARHGTAIGAWVAEMDLGLAPPVTQALHEAIDLVDTGYCRAGGGSGPSFAAFAGVAGSCRPRDHGIGPTNAVLKCGW